jgi:hypothetical protein
MKAAYLNVPLSSSTRDWYKKWFYVQQEQEPLVVCDVAQIPEQQESWSARPSSAEMVQVEELLGMFDRNRIDGPTVALNFICRRVQPCKEWVCPLYEYSRLEDPTRESTRNLTRDEVDGWLAQLFDMASYTGLAEVMWAYKQSSPPPQVNSTTPYCFEHLFPTVLLIPSLICA